MADGQYRNLDNEEYWIKRSQEIVDVKWKDIKNVEKELATQYRIALDDIQQMVSNLYTKYADNKGLSYADSIKQLNSTEIADYKAKMDRLLPRIKATNDPFLIAEYEKLQKAVKLNRFQALMNQIDVRLLEMGYEQQVTMEDWLSSTYVDNYYATMYMLQVGTGIGTNFALLDEQTVIEAITFPWSGDQFSSRIWTNKNRLITVLRQTIIQGLIKGESVQKMARNLKGEMNSNYSNALRLVRTETAYVIGESTAKGYEESGIVKKYRYISTLDDRTSKVCQHLDNNVYDLKDRQVGVNYPPTHPNCRSAVAPYFGDLKDSMRIARSDGEKYYIPANMSYKEWERKYVA